MAVSSALNTSNERVKYTIEIIQNSQNKANRTSNVTVKVRFYRTNTGYETYGTGTVYCKIDGTEYSAAVSPSQKITNSGIVLFTKTLDIKHTSNGTKTLTVSAWISHNAPLTSSEQSYSMKLTDIPVASTFTVENGTLGTAQKFTVTQADSSFSHEIKFSCGTVKDSVAVSKTTNTAPPWTPPLSLASQNTAGEKVTVTFTMTTYSGDTPIGTSTASAEYTIPSSVIPSCSITVADATNYKNTYGSYVQGKSKLQVTVKGTPIYGSPISSYKTTANGTTYTTSTFTTSELKNSGSQTINASVTDDRGRTGTNSTSISVLEYKEPQVEFRVVRCDQYGDENIEGEYIRVDYSGSISSLNGKNTVTVTIKYYKIGSNSYTSWTPISNQAKTIFSETSWSANYEKDASYDFEITVQDKLSTVTRTVKVPSVFTFFHFDGPTKNGNGKNKLDLIDKPTFTDNGGGTVDVTFSNDVLTINSHNGASGYATSVLYAIPEIAKDSVIRLSSIISTNNSGIYAYYAQGDNIIDVANLYYGDGQSVSLHTYTATVDIPILYVMFSIYSGTTASFKRPMVTINDEDMTYERYIIGVPPRLGIGKIAELDNGADFGLKARFNAGLEYPVLRAGTDVNTLLTPNFYIGANVAEYKYINLPITGGTFYLEIVGAGIDSYRQSVTTCSKEASVTYERFYHDGSWGPWRDCYYGQEVLYNNSSGNAGTVSLSKNIKNFAFLDIYFTDNNGKYGGCMKITNTGDNKTICIHIVEDGPSRSWIRRTSYVLTEYALTPSMSNAGYLKMDGTALSHHNAGENFIRITKVMGIR